MPLASSLTKTVLPEGRLRGVDPPSVGPDTGEHPPSPILPRPAADNVTPDAAWSYTGSAHTDVWDPPGSLRAHAHRPFGPLELRPEAGPGSSTHEWPISAIPSVSVPFAGNLAPGHAGPQYGAASRGFSLAGRPVPSLTGVFGSVPAGAARGSIYRSDPEGADPTSCPRRSSMSSRYHESNTYPGWAPPSLPVAGAGSRASVVLPGQTSEGRSTWNDTS